MEKARLISSFRQARRGLKATALALPLLALPSAGPRAAETAPPLAGVLAGSTLSAVTYVPRPAGAPGGGALSRLVLQAYLRGDGGALVRAWDPGHNAYTLPVERRWTLSGPRLCLDLANLGPGISPGMICVDVHVWGPRIAGISAQPYAMLDGDLQRGNAVAAAR